MYTPAMRRLFTRRKHTRGVGSDEMLIHPLNPLCGLGKRVCGTVWFRIAPLCIGLGLRVRHVKPCTLGNAPPAARCKNQQEESQNNTSQSHPYQPTNYA